VCSVDVDSLDAAMAQDPSVFDVSHLSDKMLIEESGKVVFLIDLLDNLRAEKHRCLVFSSSRRMLDIVEKVMANKVRHVSVVHIHVHIHLFNGVCCLISRMINVRFVCGSVSFLTERG